MRNYIIPYNYLWLSMIKGLDVSSIIGNTVTFGYGGVKDLNQKIIDKKKLINSNSGGYNIDSLGNKVPKERISLYPILWANFVEAISNKGQVVKLNGEIFWALDTKSQINNDTRAVTTELKLNQLGNALLEYLSKNGVIIKDDISFSFIQNWTDEMVENREKEVASRNTEQFDVLRFNVELELNMQCFNGLLKKEIIKCFN